MDKLDRALLNRLQGGIAPTRRPFAALARELGITESLVVSRLRAMSEAGLLSRFGPLYNAEGLGGELVLAALAAPPDRFDEIAERVNAFETVAHNYEREHVLNMWFVVAAETLGEAERTLRAIETATGCTVYAFPKEREYFLGLRLQV